MSRETEIDLTRHLLEVAAANHRAALTERNAIIVEAVTVYGMSLREVGALVGLSHSGVKVIVERAKVSTTHPDGFAFQENCPNCGRPLFRDPDGGPGYATLVHHPGDYEQCPGP